jgi:hypothetical protein
MKIIDYIRNETLDLGLFCAANPLKAGAAMIDRLLHAFAALPPTLQPQQAIMGRKTIAFEPRAVTKLLAAKASDLKTILNLGRTDPPQTLFTLSFVQPAWDVEFWLRMYAPFAPFSQPDTAGTLAEALEQLVREINAVSPIIYGFGHTKGDFALAGDPHGDDPAAKRQVYAAYWLNVLGAGMVAALGRDRVLATPAARVEELPGGAIIFLTRPTPEDILSDAAREAQAKALLHLRPELSFASVLSDLQARSAKLAPAERDWDSDLAPVFELILDDLAFAERETVARRFNDLRPPEPDAWRPASEMQPPDVPDPEAEVARYNEFHAEQFVALIRGPVPRAGRFEFDCLPQVDHFFWREDYPAHASRTDIDNDLAPALGAWLGKMLVLNFDGQWRPRRNRDEAAVVIGTRAWLPFLHARRYLQSRDAVLMHALTKLCNSVRRSS